MTDLKQELAVKKEALKKIENIGQQLVGQINLLEVLIKDQETGEKNSGESNNS